jgi:hypothetical protein
MILAKSKIFHLLDTWKPPWKFDILKKTFKKTFIGHIDFIPEIESSKFVQAVCKI